MKNEHDKMEDASLNLYGPIPLTQTDIIAAYKSQDKDARLLGEYWALNLRIRGLEHIFKLKKKQKEGKAYSPEPLMIMQIKAMKKYANALAIRLDYEQGGRANPEVIARIKAMTYIVHGTVVGGREFLTGPMTGSDVPEVRLVGDSKRIADKADLIDPEMFKLHGEGTKL